ncbi:mCG144559, partial [Mus musculus]
LSRLTELGTPSLRRMAPFPRLDCWIAGLLDCWIAGLLDCWIAELLNCTKWKKPSQEHHHGMFSLS